MSWEDRLQQLIKPGISNYPYRVVQIKPNRARDEEIYTLSGREEDIAANGSLFLAQYDLAQRDRINFEEWFDQWKLGFPLSNINRETSNYPLQGENQWRKPGALPKYKDLTLLEIRRKHNWRTIEYWRDSNDETNSILLSGTDTQLVGYIVQYEYQGNIQAKEQAIESDVIRYSGIPEITLHFKGFDKTKPLKYQTVKGDKSFRFMGHTDNPKMAEERGDLKLITKSDINQIGLKIKSIFATSPAYNWSKGKKQVVYHDWLRGYNLNVYCSTHTEGEKLVTAILAVRDFQINEAFIKYGEAKNPVIAYPPPTEIQVMGEKYKTPERLPTVDVAFQYAKIYLPTIKESKYIA